MQSNDSDRHILRRLEAIEEIKQLKARYFRCMDTRDWDSMPDVFTEDAVMDMRDEMASLKKAGIPVDESQGLITGRGTIVQRMAAPLASTTTVHHGHMPEIDILDDNTASGIWAFEDIILLPANSAYRRFHGFGHYHEKYARERGRWRIAHLTLTRLLREIE